MGSAALNLFIGRVVSLLEKEASLLGGVGDEVDVMKQELLTMGSFLMDAEKKNGLTEGEKMWVAQVRDIAYQVEDIIDEFNHHTSSQQVGGQFYRFLGKIIYLPNNIWVRHRIATKLQKINKTMRDIPQRSQRYGVARVEGSSSSRNDGSWLRNIGESSLFANKDNLVGIERETKLLMGWLTDGEPRLTVFSLVGMGGSGKTTLAAKAYTSDTIKRCFGCYAWITVSQTYIVEDLLKRLIKDFHDSTKEEIPRDLNSMVYKDLLSVLVNHLKTRRYLVVLDDVWDSGLLEAMVVVFQDLHLQSRIIVTTRIKNIASFPFGVPSYSHHIQPLTDAESWSLFNMKAFSNAQNKSCPPEIEPIARELVGRCGGLPLAIVTLGGLMASKTSAGEWNSVLANLSWEFTNTPMLEAVMKKILFLSYNDLPYWLKYCFLYCSIFPEDYPIKTERLIRLWLAEGFVEHVNRVRPEDIAEHYLSELISRSMLQAFHPNVAGMPEMCKMHDLMRELALSMSESEKLFVAYDGNQTIKEHETRRLSIQTVDHKLTSYRGMSNIRSLLVLIKDFTSTLSLSDMLPSGLKLLRVLDLEDMPIVKVPRELPYLFNLKYLNFKGTRIKELPNSIGNLHNLETLDIRDTQIEKLPSGIAKCKKLRHLVMYRYTGKYEEFKCFYGTRVMSDIRKLKKLQVVACIEAEGDIIQQIGDMTQLTSIGITNVREEDGMNLCVSIQKLKLLQSLDLMVADEEMFLEMEALTSPPPQLNVLILAGKLRKVPHWIPSLSNVRLLYLLWSRLAEDPLPRIGALPCLAELSLVNVYVGKALCFRAGFVKLKRLYLSTFSQLTEIVIEKGAMPDLQFLRLNAIMELKTPPLGIEHLTKLEEMELLEVSVELVDRIREGAVDHSKVKHIPRINHHETTEGMHYESLF